MQILHILDRLAGGGPPRALVALVRHQQRLGLPIRHRAVVLEAAHYPVMRLLAARAGLDLILAPDDAALTDALAQADIVHIAFWNTPPLYAFLRRPLPPLRLLLASAIGGAQPPQVLTPPLVGFADRWVVMTPDSAGLPVFAGRMPPRHIWAPTDPDRQGPPQPVPHDGFQVTYIGTLNFAKLHPDFVTMSAAVQRPDVRFLVAGSGPETIQAQAAALGAARRFDFRGFTEGVPALLNESDVFGYPLAPNPYAASENAVQEALWHGVPPVVLAHPALSRLVEHAQTGLIAAGPAEYTAAIERLVDDRALRTRLSRNAADYARAHFDGAQSARQYAEVYAELMTLPKRERRWPTPADAPAHGHFITALGGAGAVFQQSRAGTDAEALAADRQIAASPLRLAQGEGGIVHYRNAHPGDPWLHYWTALVLLGQGRTEAAQRELDAAADGLPGIRRRPFIREVLPA